METTEIDPSMSKRICVKSFPSGKASYLEFLYFSTCVEISQPFQPFFTFEAKLHDQRGENRISSNSRWIQSSNEQRRRKDLFYFVGNFLLDV